MSLPTSEPLRKADSANPSIQSTAATVAVLSVAASADVPTPKIEEKKVDNKEEAQAQAQNKVEDRKEEKEEKKEEEQSKDGKESKEEKKAEAKGDEPQLGYFVSYTGEQIQAATPEGMKEMGKILGALVAMFHPDEKDGYLSYFRLKSTESMEGELVVKVIKDMLTQLKDCPSEDKDRIEREFNSGSREMNLTLSKTQFLPLFPAKSHRVTNTNIFTVNDTAFVLGEFKQVLKKVFPGKEDAWIRSYLVDHFHQGTWGQFFSAPRQIVTDERDQIVGKTRGQFPIHGLIDDDHVFEHLGSMISTPDVVSINKDGDSLEIHLVIPLYNPNTYEREDSIPGSFYEVTYRIKPSAIDRKVDFSLREAKLAVYDKKLFDILKEFEFLPPSAQFDPKQERDYRWPYRKASDEAEQTIAVQEETFQRQLDVISAQSDLLQLACTIRLGSQSASRVLAKAIPFFTEANHPLIYALLFKKQDYIKQHASVFDLYGTMKNLFFELLKKNIPINKLLADLTTLCTLLNLSKLPQRILDDEKYQTLTPEQQIAFILFVHQPSLQILDYTKKRVKNDITKRVLCGWLAGGSRDKGCVAKNFAKILELMPSSEKQQVEMVREIDRENATKEELMLRILIDAQAIPGIVTSAVVNRHFGKRIIVNAIKAGAMNANANVKEALKYYQDKLNRDEESFKKKLNLNSLTIDDSLLYLIAIGDKRICDSSDREVQAALGGSPHTLLSNFICQLDSQQDSEVNMLYEAFNANIMQSVGAFISNFEEDNESLRIFLDGFLERKRIFGEKTKLGEFLEEEGAREIVMEKYRDMQRCFVSWCKLEKKENFLQSFFEHCQKAKMFQNLTFDEWKQSEGADFFELGIIDRLKYWWKHWGNNKKRSRSSYAAIQARVEDEEKIPGSEHKFGLSSTTAKLSMDDNKEEAQEKVEDRKEGKEEKQLEDRKEDKEEKKVEAKGDKRQQCYVWSFDEGPLQKGSVMDLGVALYAALTSIEPTSEKSKNLSFQSLAKNFPFFEFADSSLDTVDIRERLQISFNYMHGEGDPSADDVRQDLVRLSQSGARIECSNSDLLIYNGGFSGEEEKLGDQLYGLFVFRQFKKLVQDNFSDNEFLQYLLVSFHQGGWIGPTALYTYGVGGAVATRVAAKLEGNKEKLNKEIFNKCGIDIDITDAASVESIQKDLQSLSTRISPANIIKINRDGTAYLLDLTVPILDPFHKHQNIGFYHLQVQIQKSENKFPRFSVKPHKANIVVRQDVEPNTLKFLKAAGFLPTSNVDPQLYEWPYPAVSPADKQKLTTGQQLGSIYQKLGDGNKSCREYLLAFAVHTIPPKGKPRTLFVDDALSFYKDNSVIREILRIRREWIENQRTAPDMLVTASQEFYKTIKTINDGGIDPALKGLDTLIETLIDNGVMQRKYQILRDPSYIHLPSDKLCQILNHLFPSLSLSDSDSIQQIAKSVFSTVVKDKVDFVEFHPLLKEAFFKAKDPETGLDLLNELFRISEIEFLSSIGNMMALDNLSVEEQILLGDALDDFVKLHPQLKNNDLIKRSLPALKRRVEEASHGLFARFWNWLKSFFVSENRPSPVVNTSNQVTMSRGNAAAQGVEESTRGSMMDSKHTTSTPTLRMYDQLNQGRASPQGQGASLTLAGSHRKPDPDGSSPCVKLVVAHYLQSRVEEESSTKKKFSSFLSISDFFKGWFEDADKVIAESLKRMKGDQRMLEPGRRDKDSRTSLPKVVNPSVSSTLDLGGISINKDGEIKIPFKHTQQAGRGGEGLASASSLPGGIMEEKILVNSQKDEYQVFASSHLDDLLWSAVALIVADHRPGKEQQIDIERVPEGLMDQVADIVEKFNFKPIVKGNLYQKRLTNETPGSQACAACTPTYKERMTSGS